jgi:enterochelin esterase-like enzyme
MTFTENLYLLNSKALGRTVKCTAFIPDNIESNGCTNLLLINDGQEAGNLKLKQTIELLYNGSRIQPLLAIAVHANEDRLQEYGTAGRPDFKQRGAKADAYSQFIKNELLPYIQTETNVNRFQNVAYAGCSLGGLSALDIAWHHPQLFDKVGVFSGSLWWRSKGLDEGYTDADRIMHRIIRETETKPKLKFWLQTGTNDETADRNKNGIIDAIDDTIDLIKELENKGYRRPGDIQYLEIVGGRHHADTWALAMPKFLCWAFGR